MDPSSQPTRPRTVVLTGATSGIGQATARLLAPTTEHLVLHGPQPPGAVTGFLDELRAAGGGEVDYVGADYTRLDDVAALAEEVTARAGTVDVLVNNAARPGPRRRETTPAGHEVTLQVNYLATVLLSQLLIGASSGQASVHRIVNIASATHYSADLALDDLELRHGYDGPSAYARSKLAIVTHSCWLAARRRDVEVISMHPGVIDTELLHAMFAVRGAAPQTAAANVVDVLGRHGDTGTYYDERTPAAPHREATDPAVQQRLHEVTTAMLAAYLAAPAAEPGA